MGIQGFIGSRAGFALPRRTPLIRQLLVLLMAGWGSMLVGAAYY